MAAASRVWFVTGAARGFGAALVDAILDAGETVVAAVRRPESVNKTHNRLFVVKLDVTKEQDAFEAVAATVAKYGRIDVLVNNAGYGLFGPSEQISAAEAEAVFQTNFFGVLNVNRAVLPVMRKQKSGLILNFTSGLAHFFMPSCGIYSATKAALEALSRTLSAEVAPFNIKVVAVAPGAFRTDFLQDNSIVVAANVDDQYPAIQNMLGHFKNGSGKQPGDPARFSQAVLKIANLPNPPAQIVLGSDVYGGLQSKIKTLTNELETYKELSLSTDFPK